MNVPARLTRGIAALLPLTLTACATISTDQLETDLSQTVSTRIAQPVDWNAGGPEDRKIQDAVEKMLADELTMDEAVAIALLNNRTMRATLARARVARADLVQAGLLDNPVFGFSLLKGDAGSEREFSIFEDFMNVFTLSARKNLAKGELERTRLDVAQAALDLTAEVKRSYYGLLADKQSIELYGQVLDATEAAAELAARQYRAGTLSLREQAMQQSFHAQSAVEGAHAEAQFATDRERLNRLLGLWGEATRWTLPERLPEIPAAPPNLTELEKTAVTGRLDLAARRAEVDAVNMALGYTRQTRWLSAVGIGFKVKRDTDGSYSRGPEIELGLPLFDRAQGRIARLEAELQDAENRYAQLAIDVRSEVRETSSRLSAARELVAHYRDAVLPLADSVVGETLKFYNGMLVGVYELLNAKQSQISASRDYIGVWRDFWVAWADLEHALGTRIPVPVTEKRTQPAGAAAIPASRGEQQHGDH